MGTISKLPVDGLIKSNEDAAGFLRWLADNLDKGGWSEIKSLIVVMEAGSKTHTFFAGQEGFDNARAVGLLAIAQHQHVSKL